VSSSGPIAVLGATGATGRTLLDLLVAAGRPVTAVSRSMSKLAAIYDSAQVRLAEADPKDAAALTRAVDDAVVIVNCTGTSNGPAGLIDIASGLARVVRDGEAICISVTSCWGFSPLRTKILDETHPRVGGPSAAQARRASDELLVDNGVVLAHLPDFLGPRVAISPAVNLIRRVLADLPYEWIADSDIEREHVYLPDAMASIIALADKGPEPASRYIIGGSGPITGPDLLGAIHAAVGELDTSANCALPPVDMGEELAGMRGEYEKPVVYSSKRLEAVIGHQTRTEYPDAVRATVQSLLEAA